MPVISDEMKQAAQAASDITIPKDIEAKVQSLMETLNSEQWQANFEKTRGNVASLLGAQESWEQAKGKGKNKAGESAPGNRLYVFISASMPLQTLRNYARDIEKLPGTVMVLRGWVNGGTKVKPTATFVANIIRKDPDCQGQLCEMRNVEVQIDPYLFRRFAISQVPAVAFETNVEGIGYCGKDPEIHPAGSADNVVYGDASLLYAVEQLYALSKETALKPIIDLLEPKV